MEGVGGLVFADQQLNPDQLSPLVLAYVGDAVYEVFIRTRLAALSPKVHELHQGAVKYVQAAGQAAIVQAWQPFLTDAEKDVVRRGRNAKGGVPRHADTMEYRYSTGFEALLGYLYLSGQRERLKQLLEKIDPSLDS